MAIFNSYVSLPEGRNILGIATAVPNRARLTHDSDGLLINELLTGEFFLDPACGMIVMGFRTIYNQ